MDRQSGWDAFGRIWAPIACPGRRQIRVAVPARRSVEWQAGHTGLTGSGFPLAGISASGRALELMRVASSGLGTFGGIPAIPRQAGVAKPRRGKGEKNVGKPMNRDKVARKEVPKFEPRADE